jgi:hypothetical protein
VAVFFVGLITLSMSQAIFALGVADAVACLRMRTNAWVTGAFLMVEPAALALFTDSD